MLIPLTLNDFLDRAVSVYPDRCALVDLPDGIGNLTWHELGQRARKIGAGLAALGLAPGDRVAVVGANSGRILELLLAVPASGYILVPVNPRLSLAEVEHIVTDSSARLLLVEPEQMPRLGTVQVHHLLTLGPESDRALMVDTDHDSDTDQTSICENDTATINYTSGTTSLPKGVELSHRNIWLNATTLGLHIGLHDRDVYLHTLPMFHVNGWGMPYITASLGIRSVMLTAVRGDEILRAVAEHDVTVMSCAPTVFSSILDAAEDISETVPGRGVVRVVCAGAPPPSSLIERVETVLGWEFIQVYGLTETSPMNTVNRRQIEEDDLPISQRSLLRTRAGAPFLGVRLKIGSDGEILVRSNHVMTGYWNQPEVTNEALGEGWFHTGDVGYLDVDGRLVVSDRKKDVIISGGENVASIQVEDCLAGHPAIHDVAVTGTPHERWGETVTAFVSRVEGLELTDTEVITWARERLAHFKAPTRVVFLDELPRTATGKVQKHVLRASFDQARRVSMALSMSSIPHDRNSSDAVEGRL